MECDFPLSDKLYELYTNGKYAFSDYSNNEYPAQDFLENKKYKYELKNCFINEMVYYDYDLKKVVVLFEHCSELNNHVLFPLGYLVNDDKSKNKTNLKDANINIMI